MTDTFANDDSFEIEGSLNLDDFEQLRSFSPVEPSVASILVTRPPSTSTIYSTTRYEGK